MIFGDVGLFFLVDLVVPSDLLYSFCLFGISDSAFFFS